ncbi:Uncharacterised protein [uncultured archaeon]|nr:Uncharacterised protein [uncultured archaeon]
MATVFDDFDMETKKKLVVIWKTMDEQDRDHFINQVALSLSVWGSDEKGKDIAVEIIRNMLVDGSKNLADFGLYLEFIDSDELNGKADKFKKAVAVLDGYRFKHGLPSEPNKEFIFNSSK